MNPTIETPTEVLQPSALEAISNAEINQSIATARRFPRSISTVKQNMLSFATLDEETAASCFYSLPRGGKNIQGPSIRLAEIAIACYGNLRVATRIIETVTSGDSPHVTIQAVAMDLQNNTSISIEKRRRIIGKKSAGGAISEDDINLAANAGSAIALRDAVFKVVPLALVKPVFEAAKKTAIGDAKTLTDRRAKSIDAFAKMGVSKERVLAKLEKKGIDDIGLEDLETLIGLYTAIKDGDVTVDEAFPAPSANKPADLAPKMPAGTATATAATPSNVVPMTPAAASQQPAKEPEQPKKATETPKPAETPASGQPASAATPPEPAKEATELTKCKYCGEGVENMAAHNCQQMQDAVAKTAAPAAEKKPAKAFEPAAATTAGEPNAAMAALGELMQTSEVSPEAVMAFCKENDYAKKEQAKLTELSTAKLEKLAAMWPDIVDEIKKFQAK